MHPAPKTTGNASQFGYFPPMYKNLQQKLDDGQTIILDGGTGTDIQKRGAPMSGETWCAEVNLTHPDIVRAVHEDYIRAGADIITANTFATSALSFNHYGRDDDLLKIDAAAVAIARQAAEGKPVAVAGSVSTMRPVAPGSDRTLKEREWPEDHARDLFRRKVENLAKAGVDLLMMEMMRDVDYSLYATEAAIATGLPVWVGISVERGEGGKLVGFGREDQLLDDIAKRLSATRPAVMNIMHTSSNDTDEALDILRRYWKGPTGVYPECGYFKNPDWQFVDVIAPQDLVARSHSWGQQGASIFGGCCGIGAEHIAALAQEFKS
jgi:S-methylmethionine-dependent homocysteine/selenocysteine methylase